jgi:hypothetical protein
MQLVSFFVDRLHEDVRAGVNLVHGILFCFVAGFEGGIKPKRMVALIATFYIKDHLVCPNRIGQVRKVRMIGYFLDNTYIVDDESATLKDHDCFPIKVLRRFHGVGECKVTMTVA